MAGHWRGFACWALIAATSATPVAAQDQGVEAVDAGEPPQDATMEAPAESVAADPRERARELFSEGIAAIEREEWASAARKFREAMRLHDAPTIRYNLASALFELGQITEAWSLVKSVQADREAPHELTTHAATLEAQIRDTAAMISVTLEGDARDVTVTMDGSEIAAAQLGRELAVSAGTHQFIAKRGEQEVAWENVEVASREIREVTLVVPAASPVILPEEPEAPDDGAGGSVDLGDWRIWAVVGGAVLLIGVIALIAVASSGTEDPVEGNFEPGVIRW